jgi:hypothetical protein
MADINPARVTPTGPYHVTGVQPEVKVDLRFEHHGSVVLIRPLTPEGRDWIETNVETEGWQWFGGAVAAEPRYIENVVLGAVEAGLVVS